MPCEPEPNSHFDPEEERTVSGATVENWSVWCGRRELNPVQGEDNPRWLCTLSWGGNRYPCQYLDRCSDTFDRTLACPTWNSYRDLSHDPYLD